MQIFYVKPHCNKNIGGTIVTYKYLYVRKAIYDEKPTNKFSKFRDLSRLIKIYKLPYLIMMILILITLTSFFVISRFYSINSYIQGVVIAISIIFLYIHILGEKYIYNASVRKQELEERDREYEDYILCIWSTFKKYGINSDEKLQILKGECQEQIKGRKDKLFKVNNKVFDLFLGVPLGALIASIIYSDSDAIFSGIIYILLIGCITLGAIKFYEFIEYFTLDYYKDNYLLDMINEMFYSEKFKN